MPVVTVERTYLRLETPQPTSGPLPPPNGVSILEEYDCAPATYRALYSAVGTPYFWRERLVWTEQQLDEYLRSGDVRVWILRDERGAGGYFELRRHPDASVEIAYFGLIPTRHGRGLGRFLLSRAIEEAWGWGATSVWLHTCTLDGPAALPNYLARGFVPFRRETYEESIPDV